MKTRFKIILLSILCVSFVNLFSQEPCKVLKKEIADKYEGKCKNGLAHGKGIAVGKDTYEGKFKNGLPDGKGKYTWDSGEEFEGNWKEGLKDGEGRYKFKVDGIDSIKLGIWKEDVFLRKIVQNPYRVLNAYSVNRYTVQKIKEGNRVVFSFMQNGSNNTAVYNLTFSPSSGTAVEVGTKKGFENIVFPFICKVSYITLNSLKTNSSNVAFEIEIKESGEWEIQLTN